MGKVEIVFTESLFYVYGKKHFCPRCGIKVNVGYIDKAITSKSREIKQNSMKVGNVYFFGECEVREKCFYCGKCNLNISFREMKNYERAKQNQR